MVALKHEKCSVCGGQMWIKPMDYPNVCSLCKTGQEFVETYGEGEDADGWVYMYEGQKALELKKRFEAAAKDGGWLMQQVKKAIKDEKWV